MKNKKEFDDLGTTRRLFVQEITEHFVEQYPDRHSDQQQSALAYIDALPNQIQRDLGWEVWFCYFRPDGAWKMPQIKILMELALPLHMREILDKNNKMEEIPPGYQKGGIYYRGDVMISHTREKPTILNLYAVKTKTDEYGNLVSTKTWEFLKDNFDCGYNNNGSPSAIRQQEMQIRSVICAYREWQDQDRDPFKPLETDVSPPIDAEDEPFEQLEKYDDDDGLAIRTDTLTDDDIDLLDQATTPYDYSCRLWMIFRKNTDDQINELEWILFIGLKGWGVHDRFVEPPLFVTDPRCGGSTGLWQRINAFCNNYPAARRTDLLQKIQRDPMTYVGDPIDCARAFAALYHDRPAVAAALEQLRIACASELAECVELMTGSKSKPAPLRMIIIKVADEFYGSVETSDLWNKMITDHGCPADTKKLDRCDELHIAKEIRDNPILLDDHALYAVQMSDHEKQMLLMSRNGKEYKAILLMIAGLKIDEYPSRSNTSVNGMPLNHWVVFIENEGWGVQDRFPAP